MPIVNNKFFNLSKDRVEFSKNLSRREVKGLVKNKDLRYLQFSNPVEMPTFHLLNDEFFPKRPDVTLRAYSFNKQICDLSFTSEMSNLRHFSADCLWETVGIENICSIRMLESLGIGIYQLDSFTFLKDVTPNIKAISLHATKSKKPNLNNLSRFKFLEEIYLEGQQKNIEVLSQLYSLKDVTLRSISTAGVEYLKPLKQMWSLDIKLGGIKDFSGIEGMSNIKYLELWQVRGLSNLNFISKLEGLQYLYLQSLKQVTSLPSFDCLSKLRCIYLENMKGLKDVSSLRTAPALIGFRYVDASNMQPEVFLPLLNNPTLKQASIGFGSDKKNTQFDMLRKKYGIQDYEYSPFQFE